MATLAAAGCDPSDIVRKEEVQSPDGYWTVQTAIERISGPGINAMYTHVFLSRTSDQGKGTEILSLNDPGINEGEVIVTWRDKTHLELGYHKEAAIDFQAVKCAGVEISVVNLAA